MEKHFDPRMIEADLYAQWEANGYFKPQGEGPAFSIVIPPPNVTGTLHMGHGFQYTLMDILTRYHRMKGDCTLWQPGTDHAGIATQMVVERQLNAEGKTRHDIGREAFTEKVWAWKQHSGNIITEQIRRLGASVDWSRERFTMDDDFSAAVTRVFCELHQQGLIYRGKRLVNWDPQLLTAISDLEVLNEETTGSLWHLRYPLVDSNDSVVVATTRPETLFGDVAVAVHPDDERYQAWIGKHVRLPLTNRTIPIIADTYVDPAFGSGCVKITPAHDFNDYAVGMRHQCPLINIFTPTAHLNEHVPVSYQGLDRFAARARVIHDLTEQQLLVKTDVHVHMVPHGDRSGVVIEPYLTDQWYVAAAKLGARAKEVVDNGDIQFLPEQWKKTYDQWMENLEDWCISRQLWWGHRIPAWHDQIGKIYVGESEAHIRKHYALSPDVLLTQDSDVLDTWFSAALWPFVTLGWPHNNATFTKFYPTNVLVTGFDIIFFWVARMVMMSLRLTNTIPFHHVYITGLICDADGQKMSKSKGNIIDPIDLIDGIDLNALLKKRTTGVMQPHRIAHITETTKKQFPDGIPAFGTDALRFTFCAMANNQRHLRFDTARIEGYRNFCNKLWNATRFVLMKVENQAINLDAATHDVGIADAWILARLHATIGAAESHLANYRFDFLAQTLYEFVWNDYCDWYVEMAKCALADATLPAARQATIRFVLLSVMEQVCRLLHPIMPFITAIIWSNLAPLLNISHENIMIAPFPCAQAIHVDNKASADCAWLHAFITQIRTLRSERKIPLGKMITAFLRGATPAQQTLLNNASTLLSALAKLGTITYINDVGSILDAATTVLGDIEIIVPLHGVIDTTAERARLTKELMQLESEIQRITDKVSNPLFTEKAPAAVVMKEQEKRAQYEKTVVTLKAALEAMPGD